MKKAVAVSADSDISAMAMMPLRWDNFCWSIFVTMVPVSHNANPIMAAHLAHHKLWINEACAMMPVRCMMMVMATIAPRIAPVVLSAMINVLFIV